MKKSNKTYLKVVITADIGVELYHGLSICASWVVTFDGKRCPSSSIDRSFEWYVPSITTYTRLTLPGVIIGHCYINKRGSINVQLNIGGCKLVDIKALLQSRISKNTRIYVEEIGAPQ